MTTIVAYLGALAALMLAPDRRLLGFRQHAGPPAREALGDGRRQGARRVARSRERSTPVTGKCPVRLKPKSTEPGSITS